LFFNLAKNSFRITGNRKLHLTGRSWLLYAHCEPERLRILWRCARYLERRKATHLVFGVLKGRKRKYICEWKSNNYKNICTGVLCSTNFLTSCSVDTRFKSRLDYLLYRHVFHGFSQPPSKSLPTRYSWSSSHVIHTWNCVVKSKNRSKVIDLILKPISSGSRIIKF